jgi:hypothetical protein
MGSILRICRKTKANYVKGQGRLEVLSRTLTLNRNNFIHVAKVNDEYLTPLQRLLYNFIAKARVSSERTDGRKSYLDFVDEKWVENVVQIAMMDMLSDLQHLAQTEENDWRIIDDKQNELTAALLTPSEREHLWTGSNRNPSPDIIERAKANSFEMMVAYTEADVIKRTLFLTKRGYLGIGMWSVDVGDEIWAFEGAVVPHCARKYKGTLNYRALGGEVYLHGFMNGWECMRTEGIREELVQVDLR